MGTPLNGSILKGFEILSLFSEDRQHVSTALVVDHLQMNNATAHRLLMTLEEAGALRSTRRGEFALGPVIERLGLVAEQSNSLAALISPELEALCSRLNESVMASRLSRHGPTCIAVANSRRAISVNIDVGTLLPLHNTAQGKLWLAEMSPEERAGRLASLAVADQSVPESGDLEEELRLINRQGYSLNLGGNEPDIAAISMPVRSADGQMELSISVFGMLSRFDQDFIERARPELADTIEQISRVL